MAPDRTDDVVDLLSHQLREHPQPHPDRQRQKPLLRHTHQPPEYLLDALGQHLLGRRGDRYGFLHGGSSFDLWRITPNARTRTDGAEGPPPSKNYISRDILSQKEGVGLLFENGHTIRGSPLGSVAIEMT